MEKTDLVQTRLPDYLPSFLNRPVRAMNLRIEKGEKMARWRRRVGFEQLETRHMLSHVLDAGPVVSVQIEDLDVPISAVEFTAPVNISDGLGLRGAEIRLSYDTTLLDVDASSIHAGSIWPADDTMVIANVDDAKGTIHAWIFRAKGLDAGGGSLLDVGFRMTDSVRPDTTTALDLSSIRLNEDQIWADPAPQPGHDITDAVVRFSGPPARFDQPSIPPHSNSRILLPSVPPPVGWTAPIAQREGRLAELSIKPVRQQPMLAARKPMDETMQTVDHQDVPLAAPWLDHSNESMVQKSTVDQGIDRPHVPDRICVPPKIIWSASERSTEIGEQPVAWNGTGLRLQASLGRSLGQEKLLPIGELDRVLQQTDSWLPEFWLPGLLRWRPSDLGSSGS